MPKFRAILLSFTILLALSRSVWAAESARPNFVFIYTDDQRWDALGVVQRDQSEKARFPWLESPNLDKLAAEGVRFRNAFVVTSLCAPSRAAFLSGRYGHENGVVNNHTPFSEQSVTHASLLRAAGYRTGYVGKWHMGSQSGQRPGFDFSASFIGQGKYFDCPIEVNGVSQPSHGWVDDVSTDFALKFLQENKSEPFALVLGYKTCHGPFTPPPRHAATYGDAQARDVPNLTTPAIYAEADKRVRKNPNLDYFRGLRAIDENVGKLLAKLDELQLTENTVVIYSSDNGYYLGEHQLGDKRTAYEESLRIPLLLRYPKLGLKAKTIDQLALNIDLAPTLLDLAGVAIPSQMQGRSWQPLLKGLANDSPPTDWRTSFFYSYFREGRFGAPTVTAVRTESAKLIKYPGHDEWTELFDLSRDPYEIQNLALLPEHADLRKTMEAEYDRQAKAAHYHVPDFADEKQQASQKTASQNAWVLDYRFDQDNANRVTDASSQKNHGLAKGAKLVEGRDGHKARQFEGSSHIDVPNSESLDPSVGPIAIEASFRADAAQGVVVARGGASLGYCLYLSEGKPTFAYRSAGGLTIIAAKKSVVGQWSTVTAQVTVDKRLVLTIDGEQVAQQKIREFIQKNPNDGTQIGADLKSTVLPGQPAPFTGLIERVRIYNGDVSKPK